MATKPKMKPVWDEQWEEMTEEDIRGITPDQEVRLICPACGLMIEGTVEEATPRAVSHQAWHDSKGEKP